MQDRVKRHHVKKSDTNFTRCIQRVLYASAHTFSTPHVVCTYQIPPPLLGVYYSGRTMRDASRSGDITYVENLGIPRSLGSYGCFAGVKNRR